jgi:hypothetical protein
MAAPIRFSDLERCAAQRPPGSFLAAGVLCSGRVVESPVVLTSAVALILNERAWRVATQTLTFMLTPCELDVPKLPRDSEAGSAHPSGGWRRAEQHLTGGKS